MGQGKGVPVMAYVDEAMYREFHAVLVRRGETVSSWIRGAMAAELAKEVA